MDELHQTPCGFIAEPDMTDFTNPDLRKKYRLQPNASPLE
jgi:hypothetical protein